MTLGTSRRRPSRRRRRRRGTGERLSLGVGRAPLTFISGPRRRPRNQQGDDLPPRNSATTRTSTRPRSAATCSTSASSQRSIAQAWLAPLRRSAISDRRQHNIALFGAGRPRRAPNRVDRRPRFRVVADVRRRPAKLGEAVGAAAVAPSTSARQVVEEDISSRVLAVAGGRLTNNLIRSMKIIFNYFWQTLLQVPPKIHTSTPRGQPAVRALLLPHIGQP